MKITQKNFTLLKKGTTVIGKNFTGDFIRWNGCKGKILDIKYYNIYCEDNSLYIQFDIALPGSGHNNGGGKKNSCRYFYMYNHMNMSIFKNLELYLFEEMLKLVL